MYSYLASPYSSGSYHCDDKKLMKEERYREALRATAWLMSQGIHVFSPIVHCHILAITNDLPGDSHFWKKYNYAMLGGAETIHVLTIMGWLNSEGVQDEIAYGRANNLPIYLLNKVPRGTYQIVDYSVPA